MKHGSCIFSLDLWRYDLREERRYRDAGWNTDGTDLIRAPPISLRSALVKFIYPEGYPGLAASQIVSFDIGVTLHHDRDVS